MDELRILLSKPEPSDDVVNRRRRQLQNAMRGRPSRRRRGVLAGGLGLVAAAAGVAVVVTSTGSPVVKEQSARQILLAAASTAERRPASSGAYWHVKIVFRLQGGTHKVDESWTGHDGTMWVPTPGSPGTVIVAETEKGFQLGGDRIGLRDIRRLPADPAALAVCVDDMWKRTQQRVHLPARARDAFTASTLTDLLELPAPPRVRASAYRLLATVPGVTSPGRMNGGQELSMPGPNPGDRTSLVIDPTTSLIREYIFSGNPIATGTVEVADWTNHLPRVVRKRPPG